MQYFMKNWLIMMYLCGPRSSFGKQGNRATKSRERGNRGVKRKGTRYPQNYMNILILHSEKCGRMGNKGEKWREQGTPC